MSSRAHLAAAAIVLVATSSAPAPARAGASATLQVSVRVIRSTSLPSAASVARGAATSRPPVARAELPATRRSAEGALFTGGGGRLVAIGSGAVRIDRGSVGRLGLLTSVPDGEPPSLVVNDEAPGAGTTGPRS